MHVLVVGSGGRESAIRWACERHGHRVSMLSDWQGAALDEATVGVDLVVVGPEAALADGVADRCAALGVACFGPSAQLARLETSKGHTRALAQRLGLPSPAFFRSDGHHDAIRWWRDLQRPVVVKQDGLAAGKGVIVPDTPAATDAAIRELAALGPIVVEERLDGPEVSLLALCDGRIAVPLPLAQDHKRIGEGDTGPNTGGMGAYAPAPMPAGIDAASLTATFVQPVVDHLAALGTPYVGVLFAGLMLTADGPRLLEFNCRLGDPEAQTVLPLLDVDLADVLLACTRGDLAAYRNRIAAARGAALTVVVAAPGYPTAAETGSRIDGPTALGTVFERPDVVCFPAGVRHDVDGTARVSGGRVLAVTGLGDDLRTARTAAYAAVAAYAGDDLRHRRDIGWRSIGASLGSYADAGVDIDEGTRAVDRMRVAVESTHTGSVVAGVGSFGGVFAAREIVAMDDPLLVASTDGVGTKVELAARLGRHRGVGVDIVNHCVDDVLVQGARPLFFLDYVASSRLDADQVASVVEGMAEACCVAGCALLGGETAEMPGVYAPGAFDIAGTLIGVVERRDLLPRPDVAIGDVLLGIGSSGPHTNGYSLLRKVFEWMPMDAVPDGCDRPLGDLLLEPHRNYLPVLAAALRTGRVKALAHITGGGLPENLPRVLPSGIDAVVRLGSWPIPPLFQLVRSACTSMPAEELYRTLNMGIGMVVVCAADDLAAVAGAVDEPTWVIGQLVPGDRRVQLVDRPSD
jgi:phosphoribosylamine--glycine ligase/phosphoribosylaminoimidazole synthetase